MFYISYLYENVHRIYVMFIIEHSISCERAVRSYPDSVTMCMCVVQYDVQRVSIHCACIPFCALVFAMHICNTTGTFQFYM